MNPLWRDRILVGLAVVAALWLSANLAEGAMLWPLLIGSAAALGIFVRLTDMPLGAITLGGLLVGYIVGNRGFAQFMPVPGLPLLPAEIGLAIAAGSVLLGCARAKTLPWRTDALNYALLAWMMLGVGRIVIDFRQYGFLALRDFATVYYAAFFFAAQHIAQDPRHSRFLIGCLVAAMVCLPPVFALFETFPEFFLGTLTVRGVPLIFLKGDLAPLFMAVGAVLLFLWARGRHRWWARPLATVLVVAVCLGENRAALLGLIVALGWLAISRFRLFPLVQAAVLAVALTVLVGLATVGHHAPSQRRLSALIDRVVSIVDVQGRFAYRQDHGTIKSDNNQFRWVWWQSVASETMAENPALGLGFGYDLARGFLQEYNPDMAEEFTARSPHSILVTVLGRMGLLGLALFAWILVLLAVRTWRVVRNRHSDPVHVALWVCIWPIAVSACLGVVLEGPMGAVVFWSLLGLAHTYRPDIEEAAANNAQSDELPRPERIVHSPAPVERRPAAGL